MEHIITTFAHGNGPYSRLVDLVIAYNNLREQNGLARLPAVFPLVPGCADKGKEPGSRQIRFMKEIAEEAAGKDFVRNHPYEILLDKKQGTLLDSVLFKGSNYEDALKDLITNFERNRTDFQRLLEKGKRIVRTLEGEIVEIDPRDAVLALEFNNRMCLEHPNTYYVNGGAGPFVEVLERALTLPEVGVDKELIKAAIPFARRLTSSQRLHFISDPGVFSYDAERNKRMITEVSTPPHCHVPKLDTTELPKDGIYVVVTGIAGLAESGIYDVAKEMGLQIYSGNDEFNKRVNGINHPPFKVAKKAIKAQIARTGWSSVWQIHMLAEHGLNVGLLFPEHQPKDDPEILSNNLGVTKLKLGVQIDPKNPRKSLEEALKLAATENKKFNEDLKRTYGTLDGIEHIAATIFMQEQGLDISDRLQKNPVSKHY